jgi:hypothetical protein
MSSKKRKKKKKRRKNKMESISGIKLLSAAMVFGLAAVIFTSVPFLLVILRGIVHSRNNSTGGGNFLGVVLLSFVIHAISTISFMATILILDIFSRTSDRHFFSSKVIGIFWAKDQTAAFTLAGITTSIAEGDGFNEALGAWTALLTVKTVMDLVYLSLPIVVILGAMAYGVNLSTKDTYRQDYLTVIIYSGISMTCAMMLYIAWAMIATQGLFLPNEIGAEYGGGLLGYITQSWRELVGL